MTWYETKSTCPAPPSCLSSQKLTAEEWNALTTILAPYASLSGKAGYIMKINATATALEFWLPYTSIMLADGSVQMTGNLDIGNYAIIGTAPWLYPNSEVEEAVINGGNAVNHATSGMWVHGRDRSSEPGLIKFLMVGPDKASGYYALILEALSTTPYAQCPYGLKTDNLAEYTGNNGILIDGLKIKDGGFSLGSDADGDTYYRGSGALARLAKGTALQILRMNAEGTAPEWATGGGGGASAFLELTDTPSSYTDQAGKIIKVNSTPNALEFGETIGIATGQLFKIPGSIAQGDIFVVDASANIIRLAAGANGYFLKSQGAGADLVWAAIPGGGDMLKSTYDPDEDGLIGAAQTETDIFITSGARAITGDLKTSSYIQRSVDDDFLQICAGITIASNANIILYGVGHPWAGSTEFYTLNAAKTATVMAAYITRSDTPYFSCLTGLQTDNIVERSSAVGVTIDGLKIKDGGFDLAGTDADGDIYYRASGALARLAKGAAYQRLRMKSDASSQEWADEITTLTFVIDGGGEAITTGEKGHLEVPFACTIQQVTMLADQSGSIVVDIWKDTYANFPPTDADTITASAPPTISSAQKSQDAILTGWTKAISAGNILAFNVDSCTTITRVTISLKVNKG